MIIKLLVEAGSMKPSPAISQKLGPLGINIGKVIAEVNKATSAYQGLKVPVELDIDTATRDFKVRTLTPPVAELLKKEIGLKKASPMPKSIAVGNLAIEQIINIAKKKESPASEKELKAAIKSVLGTCVSSGILVESKNAKEIIAEVESGVYDELIKNGLKAELSISAEKKEKLASDFAKVQASQKKLVEELEKAKAEKAAAAGASAAGAGAGTAATTMSAVSSGASTATSKAEAKKEKK
ncbi:MAG: 50S ribosomal protein L11 [Candidatus Pacearchaeota archaeon]